MNSIFRDAKLPGINIQFGLETIGNSETSYLRFLGSFYSSIEEYRSSFGLVDESEDYAELRRVTHQLYGVVSMIGATSLANTCEKIMATVSDSPWENIRSLLDDLQTELLEVESGLATFESLT